VAQRVASVLDRFEPDWRIDPIFHHRMGPTFPFVSQSCARPGVDSAGPA
jgi:hypothetical protein